MKTFIRNGVKYTVKPCTAIAASIGDTERQNALYAVNFAKSGEKCECVVFGWDMPEDDYDFDSMCEDSSAWDSYRETLDTVRFD